MFIAWKSRVEIREYQIHSMLGEYTAVAVGTVIEDHLAEDGGVVCGGEETGVAGYAVEGIGIFVVDCAADWLGTLWF